MMWISVTATNLPSDPQAKETKETQKSQYLSFIIEVDGWRDRCEKTSAKGVGDSCTVL